MTMTDEANSVEAETQLIDFARDTINKVMDDFLVRSLHMLPPLGKDRTFAIIYAATMVARDCLIKTIAAHRRRVDPDWEVDVEGKQKDRDILSEEDIVYWALFSAVSLHLQGGIKMKTRVEELFRRLYGHDYQWRMVDKSCESDKEEIERRRARREALRPTHAGTEGRQ